jgi:hypothetical protein
MRTLSARVVVAMVAAASWLAIHPARSGAG